VLGLFQLKGDDVFKKIKVLSGGEKARVSLAKILLSPVNFLIMDEPTNHLDRISREALEQALSQYNGTLLLISHDRYFLDKLVNRVVELRKGQLIEYHGNYSYYLEKRNTLKVDTQPQAAEPPTVSEGIKGKKTKEQKRLEAEARQAISKDLNRLKNEVAALEDKISELETAKDGLESRMARPETYEDSQLAVSLQKEYAAVNKDLEQYTGQWEKAQTALDQLLSCKP
jgi:ATP-binding cassette subfamily F protein 3